jgi:hypothetical protein
MEGPAPLVGLHSTEWALNRKAVLPIPFALRPASILNLLEEVMTDQSKPLWQILKSGYNVAAEIEAIRDWLVPEEFVPDLDDDDPKVNHMIYGIVKERQRLHALLTEQALIAREGE